MRMGTVSYTHLDVYKRQEEWISRIAAAGGCSEGEMREFDNQAVEPDSLLSLIHI